MGRRSPLVIAVMMALWLQACATRSSSITEVLTDPGRYRDGDVTVAGKVTESVGFLGYGFFKVDDGTGTIWVFSRSGLPRQGAQVIVTGSVKDIAVFDSPVTTKDGPLLPDSLARALRGGVLIIEATRSAPKAEWSFPIAILSV